MFFPLPARFPKRCALSWGVALSILGGCISPLSTSADPAYSAVQVATGLNSPLFMTAPPGDVERLFIVQQSGQIVILNLLTGVLNPTPFLDIHSGLVTSGEQGLLGLAFDPGYAANGKFYVDCVFHGGEYGNGITHIEQFTVSADPDIADAASGKTLLTFSHPEANHNGGWIGFSPRAGDSGNLYITTGDGGNANDQGNGHIEPGGNAQSLRTLLGKMLRIHIDAASGTYTIPADNPFASSTTDRKEIWAYGLRNPWRDSFDRVTGRLFIGDVGQDTREEVDVQSPSNPGGGENYGWRLREGLIATPTGSPVVGGPKPPGAIDPILDYPHTTGQAIIGGYVYRGSQIPSLYGVYVFADYLGPEGGSGAGQIFSLQYDGTSASNFQNLTSLIFSNGGVPSLANPSGLGEDANGELYIADISAGSVFQIVPPPANSGTPPTPAADTAFAGSKPIQIDVLANDSDPGDASLTVTHATPPANGNLHLNEDQTITYTPDSGLAAAGTDSFTYTVSNGQAAASANVVIYSFQSLKGTYNGLASLSGTTDGYFSLSLTPSGSFTASLAGLTSSFRGSVAADGSIALDIPRKNAGPLTGQLTLDPAGTIAGILTDGTFSYSIASGTNAVFHSNTTPAPETGLYTLLLSSSAHPSEGEAGYATLKVAPSGSISTSGKLSDGTSFSNHSQIHADGTFPFFVPLYARSNPGYLGGTITFSGTGCSGTLDWIKPAQNHGLEPGFTTAVNLIGSIYQPPGHGIRALNFQNAEGNGLVTLERGGLATPVSDLVTYSAGNTITPLASGTGKLRLSVSTSSGEVHGSFVPAGSSRSFSVGGVLFQDENIGAGLFISGSSSGWFSLTPAL